MLQTNNAYKSINDSASKQPVYVAEVFWNNGNAGVDGTNDIYFATCDVNEITGFSYPDRWFPFLKVDSISSLSQTVDPINGVSSIGALDLTITDYNGLVSQIIKAADAAGHGLRRQRISICMLFKGMDWADRVTIRTMQIQDLKLSRLNEYRLTASDVQRQLQKTVFNPYSTTLTGATTGVAGATTFSVADTRNLLANTTATYGSAGFIKIDSEIVMWSSKTLTTLVIGASGRGMFGTTPAVHDNGATVSEIVVLRENPITMALKIIESSGVASANGTWDTLPARWGCNMSSSDDINESGMLEVGKLLTGLSDTPAASDGLQFEFVIDKGIEAKKFIEDSIFKILGCFGFAQGDGKYSIKAYADISNAIKENGTATLDQNNVVKWGDLNYNYSSLANQLWIDYDEVPKLSGNYIRSSIFIDSASIKKWGEAKQLKYVAEGIIPTSIYVDQLYQRFQRVMSRYSRPPMEIELTLMPKMHLLEIGDIVRVTLPIVDLFTGVELDRAFEVISTKLNVSSGDVVVRLIAQPEKANFWFQGVGSVESVTVSPATTTLVTATTLQMVARSFDSVGTQIPITAISWIATGNLTVSSTGLVLAGAVGSGTVYAVVGDKVSNVAQISVIASDLAGTVASVVLYPSAIGIKSGDTQDMTALAYDIYGNVLNGKLFTWSSSNTGVATIPVGTAQSKVLTAVANGTTNITAVETVSLVSSPITVATVATPETPTYTPPALANSAYQVGTQLTAATHPTIISGASAPYTFVNGANLPSGDYWVDGDISLSTGHTITVNGTVRLFCQGTVTINGTVDGKGRGVAAQPYPLYAYIKGFVGNGGTGGGVGIINQYGLLSGGYANVGSPALYQSQPTLSIIGLTVSGGSWTSIGGLPSVLIGSQSTGGNVASYGGTGIAGVGGSSGAGLSIIARGLYVTVGNIDLSGSNGTNGVAPTFGTGGGGGGGGGGGTFIGLVERDLNGLPKMSVIVTRVNTSGGIGGANAYQLGISTSLWSNVPATAGGVGAIITQVIG